MDAEDEIVVMVVPDYQMLEYVKRIASDLSDDPVPMHSYFSSMRVHESMHSIHHDKQKFSWGKGGGDGASSLLVSKVQSKMTSIILNKLYFFLFYSLLTYHTLSQMKNISSYVTIM